MARANIIPLSNVPLVIMREAERVKKAIMAGTKGAARRGQTLLMARTPKDRGMAKAAWKIYDGALLGGTDVLAMLYNTAPYIGILDKGARPHKVSWEGQFAIYQWVERHFRLKSNGALISDRDARPEIGPHAPGTKGLGDHRSKAHRWANEWQELSKSGAMLREVILKQHPEYEKRLVPDALNIAAAIIHKLRTVGQKPTHFVENAVPELALILGAEIDRAIEALAKGPQGKGA